MDRRRFNHHQDCAPSANAAVTHRRPWRRRVRAGIQDTCRVDDPRSRDKAYL